MPHRPFLGRKLVQVVTGETYQFFGRIRRADIECPRCGRVYSIGEGGIGKPQPKRRVGCWNARLHRFRCLTCGLTLSIGLIARKVPIGEKAAAPIDTIPTVEQALELRRGVSEFRSEVRHSREPVNVMEPPERLRRRD